MMEEIHIREGEEFIRLGQALKLVGAVENGAHAREVIADGEVSVNGEVETRRGRKLYPGDAVVFWEYEIGIFE